MIAIIDYGVGNLFSLKSSFEILGADIVVTNDENIIKRADKLVLPGVGAFRDAAEKLRKSGLDKVVIEEAKRGKIMLGICLGMQMLFEKSYEYGEYEGLSLIKGKVKPIIAPKEYKIPHIGWNKLEFRNSKSPLFKYINEGDYVYFVHSYFADECEENQIAVTDYPDYITAAVQNKNIFGTQFHPEKSGDVGLKILKAFIELEDKDLWKFFPQ